MFVGLGFAFAQLNDISEETLFEYEVSVPLFTDEDNYFPFRSGTTKGFNFLSARSKGVYGAQNRLATHLRCDPCEAVVSGFHGHFPLEAVSS
jgi:hypothetical protein